MEVVMRLFVAVVPPRPVLLELRAAISTLPHTDPNLRWERPENWHITLAFLGEVSDEALPELQESLGRAAARNAPIELSLAGGGSFSSRALWAGVQGDVARLGRLAESVASVARRCRVKVEDKSFRPHLTLARVRGVPRTARVTGTGPVDLQPYVDRMQVFRTPRWLVGEMDLFASVDYPVKHYDRLSHWPLTGR
jgi:2'-5' RNA ligase